MNGKVTQFREQIFDSLTRLGDVLPLNTPFGIIIDPVNICNFKCVYCPTGDPDLLKSIDRPQGVMDLGLFRKAVDDIAGGFEKKLKVLWLVKDGEPFINKDLGNMIAYARKKGITEIIKTTTNGSLLTRERAIEVIDAGLDFIKISIEHVNSGGYARVTKNFSDYETVRKNIEVLFHEKEKRKSRIEVHVKIVNIDLSDEEKEQFLEDFSSISDSINIETLMGWSNSGKKDFTLGKSLESGMNSAAPLKRERKVCPEPFKGLAINFDGRVSVCCVDWSLGTLVGDVKTESLVDIWNGGRLREFRLRHLMGEKEKIECCSNCHFLQGIAPLSDIDRDAQDLIKKYSGVIQV